MRSCSATVVTRILKLVFDSVKSLTVVGHGPESVPSDEATQVLPAFPSASIQAYCSWLILQARVPLLLWYSDGFPEMQTLCLSFLDAEFALECTERAPWSLKKLELGGRWSSLYQHNSKVPQQLDLRRFMGEWVDCGRIKSIPNA